MPLLRLPKIGCIGINPVQNGIGIQYVCSEQIPAAVQFVPENGILKQAYVPARRVYIGIAIVDFISPAATIGIGKNGAFVNVFPCPVEIPNRAAIYSFINTIAVFKEIKTLFKAIVVAGNFVHNKIIDKRLRIHQRIISCCCVMN